MPLAALTRPELIFRNLPGTDTPSVLRALSQRMIKAGGATDEESLFARLVEREELCSTGIGGGIAVPHCKLPGLEVPILAIGVTKRNVDFKSLDGESVRLLFLVISPEDQPAVHLQALAAISHWAQAGNHIQRVLSAKTAEKVIELLEEDLDLPELSSVAR